MTIEVSSWYVTAYAEDRNGDVEDLKKLIESARAAGVSFGSVGVIPYPGQKPCEPNDPFPYVTFLHCDSRTARRLIARAGLAHRQFMFTRVKVE